MEGMPSPNPAMGPGQPEWAIVTQLKEAFEVRILASASAAISDEIDVLMVVHPKQLSDGTKYAIDQYVLRGGRVMAFLDPLSEADQAPPSQDRMAAFSYQRHSELNPLLEAWGLRMPDGKIAADRGRGTALRGLDVDYIAWLSLDSENYNQDDATISLLNRIIMPTAGILEEVEDSELTVVPLIRTTRDSMQIERTALQFQPDPEGLLRNFVPEDEEFMLAARVSGPSRTAFPGGRPATAGDEEAPESDSDEAHLEASTGDINVVVIADIDLLEERYWLQRQQLGPIFLGFRKTADNGDFVINCIDNLSGSDDLISVRGGQKFARPFEYVKSIEREAEQDFLLKAQLLEDKIRETENKIRDLQSEREDGSSLILTPEQRAEIETLRTVQVDSRRELRAVQHDMRKDIEEIGTFLKLLHIVLVPAAFAVGALAFGAGAQSAASRLASPTIAIDPIR